MNLLSILKKLDNVFRLKIAVFTYKLLYKNNNVPNTIYKPSERALSVYTDANRRRAAICTDKAQSRGL